MTEQLWREVGATERADYPMWVGFTKPDGTALYLVPVASSALLIEDGFGAAVRRMVAAMRVVSHRDGSFVFVCEETMGAALRAAVGEGDR